jgi:hypothetical protein
MIVLSVGFATSAHAEVTAVASRIFNGYKRERLADNSFKPETYAFANGGLRNGNIAGDSIDKLPFMTIARTLARPLAQRGYVPATDPDNTDLMIFVFWGTTHGARGSIFSDSYQFLAGSLNLVNSPNAGPGSGNSTTNIDQLQNDLIAVAAENHWREKINLSNAMLLGFQYDFERASMTDFTTPARDVFEDLELNRYFVVLKAFDFQLARNEKRAKVLWETRFSIPQQGNDFAQQLEGMAKQASLHLGINTHGIVREFIPEGQVTFGESIIVEDRRSE